MKYREILELYKKNELDEQKKLEVEADIEKQEVISEYLFDKEEAQMSGFSLIDNMPGQFSENMFPDEEAFIRVVRRSIRRAFFKMGGGVLAVTIAVVIFINTLLPQIISGFYYDPGKEVAGFTNQMSLDIAVYTELTNPQRDRDTVIVDDRGYGEYDICINQTFTFGDNFSNVSGKIKKDELTLYDPNILRRPADNAFSWHGVSADTTGSLDELQKQDEYLYTAGASPELMQEYLDDLHTEKNYVVYVTLNEIMSYGQFTDYLRKNQLENIWCAVKTEDRIMRSIGAYCDTASGMVLDWDTAEYPALRLQGDAVEEGINYLSEEKMITHFTSMLEYMTDQKEFLKMMDEDLEAYSAAINYIRSNGISVYGYVIIANKAEMSKLAEHSQVYTIYAQSL